MTPKLFLIVPCYNEEAVLPVTAPLFLKKITDLAREGKISSDSRILFVGCEGNMEMELVAREGFEIVPIDARSFHRSRWKPLPSGSSCVREFVVIAVTPSL